MLVNLGRELAEADSCRPACRALSHMIILAGILEATTRIDGSIIQRSHLEWDSFVPGRLIIVI
jgi:hypothetical protein